MSESNETSDLPKFFAWARPRVYSEYEKRLQADASADPNWLFSEIMQQLLVEYQGTVISNQSPVVSCPREDSGPAEN